MAVAQGLLLAVEDEVCGIEFSSAGVVLFVWCCADATGVLGVVVFGILQICAGRVAVRQGGSFFLVVYSWRAVLVVCDAV